MPSVFYEIIKEFGFTSHQTEEVIKLLNSESGKYVQSTTHTILRNRKWLIIAPLATEESVHFVIEENDSVIKFAAGELRIQKYEGQPAITKDAMTAQLDTSALQFPLLLRKWKTGDYFYPLGMAKKKKISRFLIDQKLSLHQKQNVWVVESNKKILWVVGYRIDDRFKISGSTSDSLVLRLIPTGQKD